MFHRYVSSAACLTFLVAAAQLPEAVVAMIDAAIAEGNPDTVEAVMALAKKTNPDDVAEVDAMLAQYRVAQAEAAELAAAAKQEEIRNAGLFDRWSGEGQIGAFQSSGNNDNVGVNAALKLKREGIDWSHQLRARVDYQRSNGNTTREQYFAAYEPRYQIDDGLFAYGLAQYERDRFQGYTGRYAVSAGLGYRLVKTDALRLSVKAGPAYRVTEFLDGTDEKNLAALVGLDFDWSISDSLTLTQDTDITAESGGSATAIVDSSNTSLNLITGLQAKLSDRLTTRLSYTIEYDSNPPVGSVSTDTLTRFTLIYGF
ncbi:DUF481 domain-containing protein [Altererythrobacter sp. ZODW24]|uniref:DUF481 domain-containing protein n=1 Tax=Altererythrobacter sp. ZODW24 TaxID=2185142 RepID=UPI000DF7D0A4|nr:DUF481 domain-containing protein [Altererythrobacter sp. ZODW24]